MLSALVIAPIMLPYIRISSITGMRTYAEVENSVPRPISLFFSDPAAENWRDLAWHSQYAFPEWWHHMHFMGAVAWLGVVSALGILIARRTALNRRRTVLVLFLSWFLSVILCMQIDGIHIYKVIYAIPGFSALRSIDRFIFVQSFFFILLLAASVGSVKRPLWLLLAIDLCLPFITMLDHRIAFDWTKRFNKYDSIEAVSFVRRSIDTQYKGQAQAIAWCPIRHPMHNDQEHLLTISVQLSAMLAAQEKDLQTVNAYTGSYPDGYMTFFDHMDRTSLADWLSRNSLPPSSVAIIDNIGLPVDRHEKTALLTGPGTSVAVKDPAPGVLTMGAQKPTLEACYTVVYLTNGRIILLASNDRFVAADIAEGDQALRADAPVAGDHCMFTMHPLDDGTFALLADNGRYVQWADTGMLHAWAEVLEHAARFRFAPLPKGVR